jgi:predicted nicotinamide N-methyase
MGLSLNLMTIEIGVIKMQLYVPDPESVKQNYALEKIRNPESPFPFWAKLWPSSIAMAEYLLSNQGLLKGKNVLEIAAGLGLPSLVAALYAEQVCCSDYLPEAVDLVRKSVLLNQLSNLDCQLYNWHHLPDDLTADIMLMSDVNYDPAEFDQLAAVCEKFLLSGTTIILTTPGRIMAKEFIHRLNHWVKEKSEINVNPELPVYVFLLRQ